MTRADRPGGLRHRGRRGFLLTLLVLAVAARGSGQVDAATRPLTGTFGLDARIGLVRDGQLAALLADIDPLKLRASDSALVAFGTRNTFSDTGAANRGIGAARRWVYAQLERYSVECGGCLRVSYDDSVQLVGGGRGGGTARAVRIVNVVAWLPGRDTSRVVVVGGHYDSCACSLNPGATFLDDPEAPNPRGSYDAKADAPGADDDGSGAAAVIELARVFSKRYPRGLDHSVVFVLYDAEEQALNGSRQFAARLHGLGYKVMAAVTDDIIGNVVGEDGSTDSTSVRIFAADPDNSPSRELGRYVWGLGAIYMPAFEVRPEWRLDRIGRTGDHESFVAAGDPGLRFTERIENTTRQRSPTDDLAHVNFGYAANIGRMTALTVAALGTAPPTPERATSTRQGLGGGGGRVYNLSWCPTPGATGYEVLVRRTMAPTWEIILPAGNVTQYLLDRQNDDEYFGVRAVGANGSRSLAASMPAPTPPGQGRGGGRGGGRGNAGAGAANGNGRGRGAPPPADTASARRCG